MPDGDLNQLALLRALTDDKENAARIAALHQAMTENQAILDKIVAEREAAERAVEEARQAFTRARALEAEVVQRRAELDERERGLQQMNDTLVAERKQFEDVRQRVEADHQHRANALEDAEGSLAAAQQSVNERAATVTAREAAIEGLHESLKAKHEALRAAIADNEAA